MVELIIVLEFLKAVNLVLELIHYRVQRKKIDALIQAAKSDNQCADCFKKLLEDKSSE